MRGFGSKLLVIALLGLLIYNFVQIRSLRSEVSSLRAEIAALHEATAFGGQDDKGSSRMITDARKHLEKAKNLAVKGDFDSARNELQKSLQILEKVGRDAGAPSVNAYQSMRQKLDDTTKSIEDLWRKLGGEKETRKGGGVQ